MLDPAGPYSGLVTGFVWLTFGIAGAVTLLVLVLLAAALWRRRTDVARGPHVERRGVIAVAAAATLTAAILLAYFAASLVTLSRVSAAPADPLEVEVIAHSWWWEFRVSGTDADTANELHIPVGRPVRLRMRSVDVIHSFWVPQLAHKEDVFPGRETTLVIQADRAGTYDGVCAEYCGDQHAWMRMIVVAEPADAYERWVGTQSGPRDASLSGSEGERLFTSAVCASCHTIRGTSAHGTAGPDLTHLASRRLLAGGVLPVTPDEIAAWIRDPQRYKPGSFMPKVDLTAQEWLAVAQYLSRLD